MAAKVDSNKWPKGEKCKAVESCPVGAISQKDLEVPVVDATKCIECGLCTTIYPGIFYIEKK